jgi:hypothetical protein
MLLSKEDYANMLKLLDRVEAKGLQEFKYLSVLSVKLEQRVAAWFDGHPTGTDVPAEISAAVAAATAPPVEAAPIQLNKE